MARPTEREIRVVVAYLEAGTCKAAADDLGIRPETFRHRLSRIYVRHGVSNMAQLVFMLADDVRPHVRHDTDAPLVAEACCSDD